MPVGDVVRGLNRPLVQIDQVERDRLLGAKGLDVVLELRRAQLLAHIATRLGRAVAKSADDRVTDVPAGRAWYEDQVAFYGHSRSMARVPLSTL